VRASTNCAWLNRSVARTRFTDLLKITRKDQILHVRSQDRDTIAARCLFDILQNVIAEPSPICEDIFERHRRKRPPRGKLDVAVQAFFKIDNGMKRRTRIGDAKLHDNTDPDSHFISREDLLPFNGQFPLAHADQNDLHFWKSIETQIERLGNHVSARFEQALENTVFVSEAAMRRLDDHDTAPHRHFSSLRHDEIIPGLRSTGDVENEFSDWRH
jgi:hypothetical protein